MKEGRAFCPWHEWVFAVLMPANQVEENQEYRPKRGCQGEGKGVPNLSATQHRLLLKV